ncbi:MAG: AAA family ATPase [Spirochaetales bacterium]|nr:AAA family ATPase [Spirochaetales bacterium]
MSSLDRLTIKGFKSIKELTDLKLNNLNILVGGNGAGKTNLVSFFRMLRAMFDGNLDDFVRDSGGIGDLLYNGRKATSEMNFEAYFGVRGYRFKLKPTVNDQCALINEARYYDRGSNGWWELGNSKNNKSLLVKEATGNEKDSGLSKPVYEAISSWQIYHFHDSSDSAAMRHSEIVQDSGALRTNASNIAPYLYKLKKHFKSEYEEILDAVRMVMPFFDDFLLEVDDFGPKKSVNLSWTQKGSDYPMQPYHFSDGSIRFICLATALLQPNPPSTIIIDEPELGLHPAAISVLAELIQDAAKRTQVIIATQSPSLIDNFTVEDIIVVNREDGASTFQRLDRNKLDKWLEDYSVGELWTKNVISGGPVYE